ncbi:MAG: prolyl oligopeptidase family serine peptidase [Bacillota bacterium]
MAERRKLTASDLHRFVLVGDPQFSPDGKEILFVHQQACVEDNKNYSTLWLMNAAEQSRAQPLTHGKKNDRTPRWSPDRQTIAFVSGRSEQSKIWLLNRTGGEAWLLDTDFSVSSEPVWSPDGRQIAVVAKVFSKAEKWIPYDGAPDDDYQRAKTQAEHSGQKGKDSQVSDVKVITRISHKMDGIGYYGDLRSQIFVIDIPKEIGAKPTWQQVTHGDFDHVNPTWSPDGREVVFVACREEDADYLQKRDLWKVNIQDGQLTRLMDGQGQVMNPSYSPDGKWIAFVGHDRSYGGSTSPDLWVLAIGDQTTKQADARNVTRTFDRPVGNAPSSDVRYASSTPSYQWSADSRSLVFIYANHGATELGRVQVDDGEVTAIWQDPMQTVTAFDLAKNGQVVMQVGGATEPDRLALWNGTQLCPLTSFNQAFMETVALGEARRFTYLGCDQWEIDGWLLTPPEWDGNGALPTVLFIHGGPHGLYGSSFMFQAQILASNGMAVLYTNPRGSQSYGQKFAYAVVQDWGGADYMDIMAGVDYIIAQGIADPARLGVTGWSYGGYMTSWTITQTNRFKAALAGAIVFNRHNFYGTSDIGYTFGEHQFGGKPWEDPTKLLERSAVYYADRVTTPLLLIHGEGDLRCPIEQSEQFFTALRRQHKEAVLVRYPGEYHGFTQPKHKEDRFKRTLAWFSYYLK